MLPGLRVLIRHHQRVGSVITSYTFPGSTTSPDFGLRRRTAPTPYLPASYKAIGRILNRRCAWHWSPQLSNHLTGLGPTGEKATREHQPNLSLVLHSAVTGALNETTLLSEEPGMVTRLTRRRVGWPSDTHFGMYENRRDHVG